MPDGSEYLAGLTHIRIADIQRIRTAILSSDPDLTETVKWNAPNYVFAGADRITFRLQPGDRIELVLHRGARVRSDADTFAFEDSSGLIRWASGDRGVITVPDGADLDDLLPRILPVLHAWVRA